MTKRFIPRQTTPQTEPHAPYMQPNRCPVEAGPLHRASAMNVDSSAAYGLDSELQYLDLNTIFLKVTLQIVNPLNVDNKLAKIS